MLGDGQDEPVGDGRTWDLIYSPEHQNDQSKILSISNLVDQSQILSSINLMNI